jgi:hypothetical protein
LGEERRHEDLEVEEGGGEIVLLTGFGHFNYLVDLMLVN